MRNINKLILTLLLICVIFSCKKDTEKFANIPSLEFVKITPSVAVEFVDEVKITVLYRDKDGDLGENDPEVKNLFVTDNRNDVEYSFRIPNLTPEGSEIAVEGNFEINLKVLSVFGDQEEESADFSVYILDRALNQSNSVTTETITVKK
ncbi:MAG: hypothetical protein P8Q42_11250 [Flavobacteriales bacterium]|nr:hypothetical protein [Flavobacteriales bacterium]